MSLTQIWAKKTVFVQALTILPDNECYSIIDYYSTFEAMSIPNDTTHLFLLISRITGISVLVPVGIENREYETM